MLHETHNLHPVFMLSFNQNSLASKTNHQGPFGFTAIPFQVCNMEFVRVIEADVTYAGKQYALCTYQCDWIQDGDIDEDECGEWVFMCEYHKGE